MVCETLLMAPDVQQISSPPASSSELHRVNHHLQRVFSVQ